ncbi:MAG: aldehyde dehydrogenase family protein [Chlorobi bacterium]|nr:aldehyde dehydrogenase family protein [Chlorobiota bacterium]
MDQYEIYVAGKFKTTSTELPVTNPFTGKVFARTFLAGPDELEDAITAGLKAESVLADMPVYRRYKILTDVSEAIRKDKDRLAGVLAMESGKPYRYALGEILRAVQTFRIAAEESKRLPGEYLSIDWTEAGDGKEGWVKYFPVGLMAGISPFNFPLNLAVHKIAPALAAGNPIILKPARATPLSVLELTRILDKTGLPPGAVSVLPMDRQAGDQLVTDPRFKMLSFTGSPQVGWKMKERAGKKKILLELGGNAGVIVTPSADVSRAAGRCVTGGFAYSGQVCIHVQRIYVHEAVFDSFTRIFIEKVRKMKFGDPLDPGTEISVMIDEENAARVEAWVRESVDQGAEIILGGKKKGNYFEPTVLTRTASSMKVCSLEIFGPVVTLEKFSSFHDAVGMINDSRYGLQAGVFTNHLDEMNEAFNNLKVGGVIINDVPIFRVDHMPYGGVKDSGFGREGIKYSIHEMMEPRLLVKNKV